MRQLAVVIIIAAMAALGGVALAQSSSPSGDVVVANAYAPADALTGGPLASRLGAPLVTVKVDAVPDATARQIETLRPSRLILLGGPVVISAEVETQLRSLDWNPDVVRLGGQDRFETSQLIADFLAGQPLPAAGSIEGTPLDELVTEDELGDRLGTSSRTIEQVLPMPQDDGDDQAGPWVRTGPVRSRLVCEPDVGGLPEVQSIVEMQWVGDGFGSDDPFGRAYAYVNGSAPSDIMSVVAGMTGTDGAKVLNAKAEGWVSINLTKPDACHGVWSVALRSFPTSGN